MPLYLCHWPKGDYSFVFVASKGEAIERLDEVGNAEGCPLIPVEATTPPLTLAQGSLRHRSST